MMDLSKLSILLLLSISNLVTAQTQQEYHYGNQAVYSNTESIIKHDSFLIAAGYTSIETQGGDDGLLIKTDQSGNLIWRKIVGGARNERINKVILVEDGYVFAGETNSTTEGDSDYYLLKTDFDGNVLWEQNFGTNAWEVCEEVAAHPDGGFYLIGTAYVDDEVREDWLLIKVNDQLEEEWSTYYGTDNTDNPFTINTLSDGNAFLTGEYNSTTTFLKVDQNSGDIIWDYLGQNSNSPPSRRYINNIVELADSSLIIGGHDFIIRKLDKNGEEIWSTAFDSGEIFTQVRPFGIDTLNLDTLLVTAYVNFGASRLYQVDIHTGEELSIQFITVPYPTIWIRDVVFEQGRPILFGEQLALDTVDFDSYDIGVTTLFFDDSLDINSSYSEMHEIVYDEEFSESLTLSSLGTYWIYGQRINDQNDFPDLSGLLLTEVDANGAILNQYSFPIDRFTAPNTRPLDVLYTNENNVLLLTQVDWDSVELAMVNTEGEMLWSKRFEEDFDDDPVFDESLLRKHGEDNYLLVLNGKRFITFNESGDIVDSTLSSALTNGIAKDLVVLPDGGYIHLTSQYFIELSEGLEIEEFETITSFSYSDLNFQDMEVSADSGLWFYGTTRPNTADSDFFTLVKFDADWNRNLEMTLGEVEGAIEYIKVLERTDGSLILLGTEHLSSPAGLYFERWYAFSNDLNYRSFIEWRTAEGELLDRWEFGTQTGISFRDAKLTEDGQLVVTGWSYLTNNKDQYLVKFENDFFVNTDEPRQVNYFYSQVVPNPGNASLRYNFRAQGSGFLEFQISNLAGQKIYQENLNITSGTQSLIVQSADWPQGMYIIQAFIDGELLKVDKWVKGE